LLYAYGAPQHCCHCHRHDAFDHRQLPRVALRAVSHMPEEFARATFQG
jgi:hypothetical protein